MASERDRTGLIPIERELRERLAWFIRLRWMAAAGIFLGGWVAAAWVAIHLSPAPIYAVGGAVICYNGLFAVLYRRFEGQPVPPKTYRDFVSAQIGLDWASLTCLVHYSGGIQSPVALAFTFHLIIGAILLSQRACYVQAGAAALLLGALGLAEATGLWASVGAGGLDLRAPAGPLADFYRWLSLAGLFFVAVFLTTSITARLREKEEALFTSERALDRAYREMEAFHEQKAWFARVTVHQFRAPLAAIQGLVDALPYAGPISRKQAELIERCCRRVEELLDTVRDLLDLASAQSPPRAEEAESVVLLECIEGVLDTVRDRANGKGVRLEVEAVGGCALVYAQAEDLRRVFSNLLDNGVKYTPSGGRVTFRVEGGGDSVRAEVVDTGIGIAEADQGRVFDGFYRTEAAKATGEAGTGLGLSIVKQLVERWGGKIELQSSPGRGSRFIVTLPAGQEGNPPCTKSG